MRPTETTLYQQSSQGFRLQSAVDGLHQPWSAEGHRPQAIGHLGHLCYVSRLEQYHCELENPPVMSSFDATVALGVERLCVDVTNETEQKSSLVLAVELSRIFRL